MTYSQLLVSVYLSPVTWMLVALGGVAGTFAAYGIARVSGDEHARRPSARKLGLGMLVFVLAPGLMLGPSGPLAAFLYLAVAPAVLAKQGRGPVVAAAEAGVSDLRWGTVLTRGVAFATGGMLAVYVFVGLASSVLGAT